MSKLADREGRSTPNKARNQEGEGLFSLLQTVRLIIMNQE